jgi:hypothetical protein
MLAVAVFVEHGWNANRIIHRQPDEPTAEQQIVV